MRRVRHVAGRAHRRGDRAVVVVTRTAGREHDAFEHGGQQVRLGATLAGAADLLVVEQHEHRPQSVDRLGRQQGLQAGEAGRLVVESWGGDELAVRSDAGARLHRVGHQLETEDVLTGQVLSLAQPRQELTRLDSPDGVQVPLRVDVAALAVPRGGWRGAAPAGPARRRARDARCRRAAPPVRRRRGRDRTRCRAAGRRTARARRRRRSRSSTSWFCLSRRLGLSV